MSNVKALFGNEVPQAREPKPDLIEALEELLEMARSGEVQGVAWAALHADRLASWRVAGAPVCYPTIGALAAMQTALCEQVNRE